MKVRDSIEPIDRICEEGYGFLWFAKNIGTHATKVIKSMSNKYSQKLLDSNKKSTTNAIKTASKKESNSEKGEAIDDLIGNKTADKITKASKEFHSKNNSKSDENESDIPKERHVSPEKRQQIIDEG